MDGSIFHTFWMVLINFHVENKLNKTWFFQKTFLVANTTSEVILGIFFFSFSNVDI